ncbi:MAG: histidine phosphatase family protein [Chloroflexota bacterium]
MSTLILIKHAMPVVNPSEPAPTWPLSEEGRLAAGRLARRFKDYNLAAVYTSMEPKAADTGQIIAETLTLPCRVIPDLHEQDMRNVGFIRQDWQGRVRQFFEQPAAHVLGAESANEALDRFKRAVNRVMQSHPPEQSLAIVAHGRVISLFTGYFNAHIDPFDLWQRLDLPAYVVLERPSYDLKAIIERLDPA